jgi:hypothetical protein
MPSFGHPDGVVLISKVSESLVKRLFKTFEIWSLAAENPDSMAEAAGALLRNPGRSLNSAHNRAEWRKTCSRGID